MKLSMPGTTLPASPSDLMDYGIFSRKYRDSSDSNELRVFEKFHAARLLLREGFDVYLDATVVSDDDSSTIHADACGIKGDYAKMVFCITDQLTENVAQAIRTINNSSNSQAVILSPEGPVTAAIQRQVQGSLGNIKVRIETLGWFDDTFQETFQRTLRLIDLMVNETRMRMLAPLFQKSGLKKEYRTKINPKLVYHNLTALSEAGLVDEPLDGTYELSPFGKTVMAEFIAFLEKTRQTLDEYHDEEVN